MLNDRKRCIADVGVEDRYFSFGSLVPVGRTEKPPFAVARRANGR